MLNITDLNFVTEVLDFDGIVFVDFWAEWCGPCKSVLPKYVEMSTKFSSDRVKFVKYEAGADNCDLFLTQYKITSIPSFIAFKNGSVIERMTGNSKLEEFVTGVLKNND